MKGPVVLDWDAVHTGDDDKDKTATVHGGQCTVHLWCYIPALHPTRFYAAKVFGQKFGRHEYACLDKIWKEFEKRGLVKQAKRCIVSLPVACGEKPSSKAQPQWFTVMDQAKYDALEWIERSRGGADAQVERGKCLFYSLVKALHFCHMVGCVHGDVKPDNVLVYATKKKLINKDVALSKYTLKLSDFGHAAMNGQCMPWGGTSWYLAPELKGRAGALITPTPAMDMWSAGIVLLVACMRENPDGPACTQMLHNILRISSPQIGSTYSSSIGGLPEEIINVAAKVCAIDPEARWTAAELILELDKLGWNKQYIYGSVAAGAGGTA